MILLVKYSPQFFLRFVIQVISVMVSSDFFFQQFLFSMIISKSSSKNKQVVLKNSKKSYQALQKEIDRINRQCHLNTQSYLRIKLNKEIQKQVKKLQMQEHIIREVQMFKMSNKHFGTEHLRDRVKKFRIKEKENLIGNYEKFQLEKKAKLEKSSRVLQENQTIRSIKQNLKKSKSIIVQQRIEKIKQNFDHNHSLMLEKINQDQTALQKIYSQRSDRNHSFSEKYERHLSDVLKRKKHILQQSNRNDVQKFVNKLQKVQSRVLKSQLKKQDRKISSYHKSVVCHSTSRDKRELDKTLQIESMLNTKMSKYSFNKQAIKQNVMSLTASKIFQQRSKLKRVLEKKQHNNSVHMEKILSQYSKKTKYLNKWKTTSTNSKFRKEKQTKNILYYRQMFRNQIQNTKELHQKQMKRLFGRVRNWVELQDDKKLNQTDAKQILKHFISDKQEFSELKDVLIGSKRQYAEKKLQFLKQLSKKKVAKRNFTNIK